MKLEFLHTHIEKEIDSLEKEFDRILKTTDPLITQVGNYVLKSGGKRLRPSLVILGGKIFGGEIKNLVKIAATVELIHTATLLHDDVIDHSQTRRGKATANAKWGTEIAILVADYLFSKAFEIALDTLNPEVLRHLAYVTGKMCEGELFQIQKRDVFLTLDDYYKIIRLKTAFLFGACPSLGALSAGASDVWIKNLAEFGLDFGTSFQIVDDTLDYTGTPDKLGKAVGNDLKEGKQTLPLIYTIQSASPDDRDKIIYCFNNGRDFRTILNYITTYDGIKYSFDKAKEFSSLALNKINNLPENEYSQDLKKLTVDMVERKS